MRILITIFLLVIQTTCFCQLEMKTLLDSVIARTKQTSMYSSVVNWDSLEKQVCSKVNNAKTLKELKPAFTALLNGLKDHHARIIDATDYSTLANFTDYENLHHPDNRPRLNDVWKVVNDTALHFEYKMLTGNVAYLKIVGIPPNVDLEKEAKKIRGAVIKLTKMKASSWIIDLRYNGGGNMHPMVTGIASLIGDGKVGSTVDLKGVKQFDWEIKSSNFIYFGTQPINLPNEPKFKNPPKIAVLISRYTVSSGEIVATCLKGRLNTKFFGEASGALTSNNNWEIIDGKVILNISTGIYSDRNGTIYKYNIPVDTEVPFELTNDVEKDKAIILAKNWLID